ncbi:hypothetical protein Syun_012885 [Stephania yunnanensis]|uniref:Uncharacterized protein n=1 Tax=Stephania yunnanensis TaxID=152371 RepID=A0AAP0PJC3_9MAGN
MVFFSIEHPHIYDIRAPANVMTCAGGRECTSAPPTSSSSSSFAPPSSLCPICLSFFALPLPLSSSL